VKFVRRRDDDGIDAFAIEHRFEAAEGFLNFQFAGDSTRSIFQCVSDSEQLRVRDEAPQIFCVATTHFANS
jgi:hypothetical protein